MYNLTILIVDELKNNTSHLKELISNNFDSKILTATSLEEIETKFRNNNIDIVMIGMDISQNKYLELIENVSEFYKSKNIPIFSIRDIYEQKSVKTTNFAKVEYIPFLENDALLIRKLKIYICIFNILKETNRKLNRDNNVLVYSSRFSNISEMIKLIYDQLNHPFNILYLNQNDINVSFYFNEIIKSFKKDFSLYNKKQINILNNSVNGFLNIFNKEKNVERFVISTVINEVINFFHNRLKVNKMMLNMKLDENLNAIGNKLELSQVLLNILNLIILISNEKKYENNNIDINLYKDQTNIILVVKDQLNKINNELLDSISKQYFKIFNDYKILDLYISKLIISKSFNGVLEINNMNSGVEFKIILNSYE